MGDTTDKTSAAVESEKRHPEIAKIVDSHLFTGIARLAMIFTSVVGLPVAGWLLLRVVSTADKIVDKVDKQGVQIILLEQSVNNTVDIMKRDSKRVQDTLSDHEGRIRILERTPAPPAPVVITPPAMAAPTNNIRSR